MTTGTITFDLALFRRQYPAFTDPPFTDEMITDCASMALCFISNQDYGCLRGDCRRQALNLMVAHLCTIRDGTRTNPPTAPGVKTSATVGSVSVGLAAPPFGSSQWKWWLHNTPYGAQLLALLGQAGASGLYIGGRCERAAFRKVGGRF